MRFSKQAAPFLVQKYLNDGTGESAIGGASQSAPSGVGASQWQQNYPGDRYILSAADALALSNTSVGTLYAGTYRYVATLSTSSSSPARAHAAFWDTVVTNNASNSATDQLYRVTSDEAANFGVTLFAGVYISNITKGNYGFIQESGKVAAQFATAITGTPALGKPVYLYGGGNNNNAVDVGSFDQLNAATAVAITATVDGNNNIAYNLAYTVFDTMFARHVGLAEATPSNNNISLIDINANRISFRW